MTKFNMGIVKAGSSLRYLKILPSEFAPGIWAGTEGLTVYLYIQGKEYPLKIKSINFNSKTIKTDGNLNIRIPKDTEVLSKSKFYIESPFLCETITNQEEYDAAIKRFYVYTNE